LVRSVFPLQGPMWSRRRALAATFAGAPFIGGTGGRPAFEPEIFPPRSSASSREWTPIERLAPVVGDGATDDTSAVRQAYRRAADLGCNVLWRAGRFLVTDEVEIAGGVCTRGAGHTTKIIKGAQARTIFTAQDVPASTPLMFEQLQFVVAPDTPSFVQENQFIHLVRCHAVVGDALWFDSLNGVGAPTLFGHLVNLYGDDQRLSRIRCRGSYGNCIGPNGDGRGRGGKRHFYQDIVLTDFVDTGVGLWTGAEDFLMTRFHLAGLPPSNGARYYDRASIDCAGVTRAHLADGVIEGGTFGVRCATNLAYTNKEVTIENVRFIRQVKSTEPAQAIKVSKSDDQDMSIYIKNCLIVVDGGNGLLASNSSAIGDLTVGIDGCRFVGSGAGVQIRADGGGQLTYTPGTNDFADFSTMLRSAPFVNMGHKAIYQRASSGSATRSSQQSYDPAASRGRLVAARTLDVGYYRVKFYPIDAAAFATPIEATIFGRKVMLTADGMNEFFVALNSVAHASITWDMSDAERTPVRSVGVQRLI